MFYGYVFLKYANRNEVHYTAYLMHLHGIFALYLIEFQIDKLINVNIAP
uniref:Uncharacterized protein n=1 Tax=Yersinia enterocolitica W22703 TaxID=913028 RepID=F4MW08_YEREN|nr:unknown protein [Yersinia enterocolitica W22703]